MANMKLTIQHNNTLYEPPVEDAITVEWERKGAPGKLTFTTLQTPELIFEEGDPVCFYYDGNQVFMGYVFTKKQDKERRIRVTCYDQIRYLKNKYTYAFEKKTATQIIKSLCDDFGLHVGEMDNTSYIIPHIVEENKAAHDIILDVLEETLTNTGKMFVIYDDFGKLKLKNCANMISTTLLVEDTAENFDYSSSIDNETYNQVILYYKNDDKSMVLFSSSDKSTIDKWGTLRYFEEVTNPTIGKNKAESLLKLYNRKTRDFKVTGAFGDVTVRGGTLIPIKLDLGDITVNNYMLVDKVTHNFENDHYTMDLTLEGFWEDHYKSDIVSRTIGTVKPKSSTSSNQVSGIGGIGGIGGIYNRDVWSELKPSSYTVRLYNIGDAKYVGMAYMVYTAPDGQHMNVQKALNKSIFVSCAAGTAFSVTFKGQGGHSFRVESKTGEWIGGPSTYTVRVNQNSSLKMRWVR